MIANYMYKNSTQGFEEILLPYPCDIAVLKVNKAKN